MFMVGALLRSGSISVWVLCNIACMGSCLGCESKPKLTGEPCKGQRKNSRADLSEECWWTSSTCDMENTQQSYASLPSTSSLSLLHDAHGTGASNRPSEFVNHGLIFWKESRLKWRANKKPENRGQKSDEPKISWNATYSSLLTSNKPFRQPIPLGEMIDFLVDIWEQEGMYD